MDTNQILHFLTTCTGQSVSGLTRSRKYYITLFIGSYNKKIYWSLQPQEARYSNKIWVTIWACLSESNLQKFVCYPASTNIQSVGKWHFTDPSSFSQTLHSAFLFSLFSFLISHICLRLLYQTNGDKIAKLIRIYISQISLCTHSISLPHTVCKRA